MHTHKHFCTHLCTWKNGGRSTTVYRNDTHLVQISLSEEKCTNKKDGVWVQFVLYVHDESDSVEEHRPAGKLLLEAFLSVM